MLSVDKISIILDGIHAFRFVIHSRIYIMIITVKSYLKESSSQITLRLVQSLDVCY